MQDNAEKITHTLRKAQERAQTGKVPLSIQECNGYLRAEATYGRPKELGADEQMLTAELWISRALGVSLKVVHLSENPFKNFGIGGVGGPQRNNELFDFSPCRVRWSLVDLYPSFLITRSLGYGLRANSQRCWRA
jgi:hypothetical protein